MSKLLLLLSIVSFQPLFTFAQTRFTVVESKTGNVTAARVKITKKAKSFAPAESLSVMYGLWDHADGYRFQPDSSFYVDGPFRVKLPPGEYSITISKGFEYVDLTERFTVKENTASEFKFNMERWIDMASKNWFSADDHIHIRRSPREDSLLVKWLKAENLNVGVFLKMGDFWATYYDQYDFGKNGSFQQKNFMLVPGQEDPRTPELGHSLSFGASIYSRSKEYYLYDIVFDQLHKAGGLTGYAHQGQTFKGYRGLMLDGLRDKVDMLEIIQYCADEDPLYTKYYYHLLDLGFPITAVAGSDFPWCGHDHDNGGFTTSARIGNVRFYTYLDDGLSFEKWKQAVAKGRTFATNGPMLMFTVNDSLPGSQIDVKAGEKVKIKAEVSGHATMSPLQRIDIISHGKVIASRSMSDKSQSNTDLSLELDHTITKGQWIAAVAYGPGNQRAHTTPIYISVNGSGFHNPETLQQYLNESEKYLQEIRESYNTKSDNPELNSWRYKKPLEERIKAVEDIIDNMKRLTKR